MCFAMPAVTFPVAEHHRPLAGTVAGYRLRKRRVKGEQRSKSDIYDCLVACMYSASKLIIFHINSWRGFQ